MRRNHIFSLIYVSFPALLCFALFIRWKNYIPVENKVHPINPTGEELAHRYCQLCHLFPEPDLLDKKTWANGVLPNMAMRLGIKNKGDNPFKGMDDGTEKVAKSLNIYPDTPLILKDDWEKIVAYYKENAPKKLPPQEKNPLEKEGTFPFKGQFLDIGDNKLPQVTLLKFNPKTSELYIGDYLNLYTVKNTVGLVNKWKLDSPSSHLSFQQDSSPLLLTIGHLGPSDEMLGTLSYLTNSKSGTIFTHLRRPVNFALGDLNMDHEKDIVICNFGNYGGKLSWYENMDPSKEHILSNLPGATRVEIKDLNGDHKPDIVALMAQAREQIDIYYNKGNGEFEEKPVLQFSPVHGTSYFEMADFNNDGYEDLLVTNGDNRDHSPIDKPYHGIRIYLNDGKNNFKEAYFYPMYECSKAMARDFDGDGDLDIVAISFYNEYTNAKDPKKSFVYLSNDGDLHFTPSFLSKGMHGKWLTMEVGDFNQDNLLDVMLGTCIFNFSELGNVIAATGITSFSQVLLLTQIK